MTHWLERGVVGRRFKHQLSTFRKSMDLLAVVAVVSYNCHASAVWSQQPCATNVANNNADIVTRWGRGIGPSKVPVDLVAFFSLLLSLPFLQ